MEDGPDQGGEGGSDGSARTITGLTLTGRAVFLVSPAFCIVMTAFSLVFHLSYGSGSSLFMSIGFLLTFMGLVLVMLSAVKSVSISEKGEVVIRKPFRSFVLATGDIREIRKQLGGFYANSYLIVTKKGKFFLSPLVHARPGALQVELDRLARDGKVGPERTPMGHIHME